MASLNDLEVLTADVAGAYLNAPCAEKVYTILGEEFGNYAGRKAIIVMAPVSYAHLTLPTKA